MDPGPRTNTRSPSARKTGLRRGHLKLNSGNSDPALSAFAREGSLAAGSRAGAGSVELSTGACPHNCAQAGGRDPYRGGTLPFSLRLSFPGRRTGWFSSRLGESGTALRCFSARVTARDCGAISRGWYLSETGPSFVRFAAGPSLLKIGNRNCNGNARIAYRVA
jgi:hypothetical protein